MTSQPIPLERIAPLFGAPESALTPMAGGHFSHVYECTIQNRTCILRITPPNEDISRRDMQAVLEWLDFLGGQGGPVARPIRSQAGSLIEAVEVDGQDWLATAFEKAPGILAEGMAPDTWSDALFRELGSVVGKCHRIASQYRPPEGLRRPDWNEVGNCFNPRERLKQAHPAVIALRNQALSAIRQAPVSSENCGLIHTDLHFGNFFVDSENGRITLFDFDDCAYGWYLMDIAMLLFDIVVVYAGADQEQFAERFLKNLLRGYSAHMPVHKNWVHLMPHFLKLVEIGVFVMLGEEYDPDDTDEWVSKFMPNRRERILGGIPYLDLDFERIAEN